MADMQDGSYLSKESIDSGGCYAIATAAKQCAEHIIEHNMSYPVDFKSAEEWHEVLRELIWLMDVLLVNDLPLDKVALEAHATRVKAANELFGKYWMNLWC